MLHILEKLTGLESMPFEDMCDTCWARDSSCWRRDEAVSLSCRCGSAVWMAMAKSWPVDSSHKLTLYITECVEDMVVVSHL